MARSRVSELIESNRLPSMMPGASVPFTDEEIAQVFDESCEMRLGSPPTHRRTLEQYDRR